MRTSTPTQTRTRHGAWLWGSARTRKPHPPRSMALGQCEDAKATHRRTRVQCGRTSPKAGEAALHPSEAVRGCSGRERPKAMRSGGCGCSGRERPKAMRSGGCGAVTYSDSLALLAYSMSTEIYVRRSDKLSVGQTAHMEFLLDTIRPRTIYP